MTTKVKVWYILIDDEKPIGDIDSVTILNDAFAVDLKDKIKERNPDDLVHVHGKHLDLWKRNVFLSADTDDVFNAIKAINFKNGDSASKLNVTKKVASQLKLKEQELLLVPVPSAFHKREATDVIKALSALNLRDENLSRVKKTESFSIENMQSIEKAEKLLFNGRIEDQYALPVALFQEDLAALQHELETIESQVDKSYTGDRPTPDGFIKIDSDLFNASKEFYFTARQVYVNEDARWKETKAFFTASLGMDDFVEQMPSTVPKAATGALTGKLRAKKTSLSNGETTPVESRADAAWGRYIVFELKNESGRATLQASIWYLRSCDNLKGIFPFFMFPIVIIAMMGTVLKISIAVCLERVVVQKVFSIEIVEDDEDDKTIMKLALIGLALRNCAEKLRQEYQERTLPPTDDQPCEYETWHLPRPTATLGLSMPSLKFKSKLGRSNEEFQGGATPLEMRSLYVADYTPEGESNAQEVVVKFVCAYNESAHRLLAEHNYAPKLHACVPVLGNRKMVVMERVNGKRIWDWLEERPVPDSVLDDVRKALDLLHAQGLVFADLRDTNVMVEEGENGEVKRAKLIDFDWTDIDGKGTYPARINTTLIGTEYSLEVSARGLMCKADDLHALELMRQRVREASSSVLQ